MSETAAPATSATAARPVGQPRGVGFAIVLTIVTFGIYLIYWYYKTHSEMKSYSGQGLGGGIAVLIAIFVGIIMPFVTASEVGGLYDRDGQAKPVSGKTGFWILLPLLGIFIWISKVQGALNRFWESKGATA